MNLNILVTSCGGDIGLSLGKLLKDLGHVTFGMDISSFSAAKFVFDHFDLGIKCSEPDYLRKIETFIEVNQIDVLIPASEPEQKWYTDKYHEDNPSILGAKVILANKKSREIGFNKKHTSDFLKQKSLPYPKIYSVLDDGINFPVIGKPLAGAGSNRIFMVNHIDEMKYLTEKYDDLLFQEYLDDSMGEFTCGLYRSSRNEVRHIIYKRELSEGGYSNYGEVVENILIDNLLIALAKDLDLLGSINVQLRIHKDVPVVFEINPRFSSTVYFRHLMGFKDVLWSLQDCYFGLPISDYVKPKVGSKFYKGFEEFIEV